MKIKAKRTRRKKRELKTMTKMILMTTGEKIVKARMVMPPKTILKVKIRNLVLLMKPTMKNLVQEEMITILVTQEEKTIKQKMIVLRTQ
jgi:hypothetical protein